MAPSSMQDGSEHASTPEAEDAMLAAWRNGDEAALGDLLSVFKPRIWSICWRTLHHYEDAADLTQDVMVRVIKGLPSFDGRSKLSTWIFRIAVNSCLSHLRKQKLRRHPSLDAPAMGQEAGERAGTRRDQLASGEPDAPTSVEQTDELQALSRALLELDGEQRLLLMLRDMYGTEYVQLSEVFEVPIGTIKSRLFRARAALCELVTQPEPGRNQGTP